jgi:hypothetical protein
MALNDLFDYMRNATHQMQSEYERIQKRAVEDPGTAGDNGEENWAELLRRWLPKNYHVVTKGRIMNTKGECGPQVDVLVLSPSYPEALIGRKEYLEGGVIAAFECKLTLKAEHIRKAVKNAAEIHRLSQPPPQGTPYKELYGRVRYGLLAHSHVWQGEQSTLIENIESHLLNAEITEAQHPREVLDMICVSDLAAWSTYKIINAGQDILSLLSIRYQHLGELWDEIQKAGGVIETPYMCCADVYQTTEEKKQLFTPIGAFLATLLAKLAWVDAGLRPLAEYFILADLLGSGQGKGKIWPLTVLSDELAAKLRRGGCLVSGHRWHEWSMWL